MRFVDFTRIRALPVTTVAAMRFKTFIPYAPMMLALGILGGIGLAIGSSPVLG